MLLWLMLSFCTLILGQDLNAGGFGAADNSLNDLPKIGNAFQNFGRVQPQAQQQRQFMHRDVGDGADDNVAGNVDPGQQGFHADVNNPRVNMGDNNQPQINPNVNVGLANTLNKRLNGNYDGVKKIADDLHKTPVRKTGTIKLQDQPECANDIKMYCSASTNNFAILNCLQYDLKSDRDINEACQHIIWNYKNNLTTDLRFESAAGEVCKDELSKFTECEVLRTVGQRGNLIPCLIEYKSNITVPNCKTFLTKMGSIVFSDYRLIRNLVTACGSDISRHDCGRLHKDEDDSPHSQGRTVECLSQHVKDLAAECKHEILRIAELQADDYHLDRPLFYACREDRERLCARTKAGNGKVYKCLTHHKFDREMSTDCREKLTQRQILMQSNFRVNKGLAQACQRDIVENKCLKDADPGFKHARLSRVVLCLENVMKEGGNVDQNCVIELKEVRRSLMEDYKISPEVVSACANDINSNCGQGVHREGVTLHCLMDLARPRAQPLQDGEYRKRPWKVTLEPQCQKELELLIQEVDPGEDWSLDPVLRDACQSVVDVHCKDVPTQGGEGLVLSCLMEHLDKNEMNADCEERLMEIHYFLARDFRLDPRLFRQCHGDARELCGAENNWHEDDSNDQGKQPLVFACLYRRLKSKQNDVRKLNRQCAFEVRRVMRQRAISVELEPRIEEPCMGDLGAYCSDDVERGEEVQCLQRNFDELTEECQYAVGNFTEDEDKDPRLDRLLMKACSPMIKDFCEDEIKKDADPADVMECLIKHKDDDDMDEKCAAGVKHHQLVAMHDYHFSVKFKEACKDDVLENCKGLKKKFAVVSCLSELTRNAVLKEEKHVVTKKCRRQLSFELLQMSEDIDLDPKLQDQCQNDIRKFCSNKTPGHSGIIDCLKKNEKYLSANCGDFVFKRQEDAAVDARADFLLMHSCKRMIKQYCKDSEPSEIFQCLVSQKTENSFDYKCKKVLIERQRQRNTDYRLSPMLIKSCHKDIMAFCQQEVQKVKTEENGVHEGKVIECLKQQFLKTHRLSDSCQTHMRGVIKEVAQDYQQDPQLVLACSAEIDKLCSSEKAADASDPDGGRVIDCLKTSVAKAQLTVQGNIRCITEIARILAEDRADIQVDPLLYRECALDIKHYCHDVPRGEGRQMSCMLAALEDKKVTLKPTCKKMLTDRVKMWEMAADVAPPKSLMELARHVTMSESRNYFLGVIFTVIGLIFIGGLMCGRVTKRVRQEIKNR